MKKETETRPIPALTTQQRLDQIDQQINDADQTVDRLRQTSYNLREQRQKLLVQLIREQKLLQGTKWRVVGRSTDIRLIPYSRVRSPEIEKLDELLRTDYHCSVDLMEKVVLRFDDSDICIWFKDSTAIIPCIREYELNVVVLDIRDQIDQKKREIAALEEVITLVGYYVGK